MPVTIGCTFAPEAPRRLFGDRDAPCVGRQLSGSGLSLPHITSDPITATTPATSANLDVEEATSLTPFA
ncbi:hypothetical protein [Rhodococcus aetherivorans]|uniref:hypothetical protein n=1 Tax=Rhodococcus aetherivorans TaxID=191292 RepID=UPI0002D21A5D|nr:hypothetical protein [Rhodococcus aetherivorans]CCW15292.1 hypothetical protein EBESD8_58640 [Rhodococcus aetherivorans]